MDSHALPPTHPMGSTHIVGSGIVGLATAISLTRDAEAADIITRHDKQVRSLIDVSESKEVLDFKEIETCPQPVASVVTLLPRKTPLTAFAGTGRRQHLQYVQSLYRRPSTATGGLLAGGTLTRARQIKHLDAGPVEVTFEGAAFRQDRRAVDEPILQALERSLAFARCIEIVR